MLKILQATIIPVLLCANLLGDEYGVEKWPKLIKGVSWGMSPEVAKKAMKKAGHRFVEESSITEKRLQPYTPFAGPKIGQKLQRIVLIEKGRNQIYGGKYFGLGTDFYFSFDSDDGLVEMTLRSANKGTKGIINAAKLGNLMREKYGEPSSEDFILGGSLDYKNEYLKKVPELSSDYFAKGFKFLTKEKASPLVSTKAFVHYTIDYKIKRGRKYLSLYSNNKGAFHLTARGPKSPWLN